jgi:hypothetical protein
VPAIVSARKVDEHQVKAFVDLRHRGARDGWFAIRDFKNIGCFGFGKLTEFVLADDHNGLHACFVREIENVHAFGIAHVHEISVVNDAVIFHAQTG